MFRFINSSLKQSVKAIPNTLCHSPSIYKKVNDDENDNKFPVAPQIKYDQTLCIYKCFNDNPSYIQLDSFNSLLERKNFILEYSFDPFKSWINTSNRNYQQNITIYRLNNNDTDSVIINKSKKKALLFNKVKSESKKCMNPVKVLRLVTSGSKQSANTYPDSISNFSALFKEKDDNDNKLSINQPTKYDLPICIYPNFSHYYVLLEKKNLIPELPPNILKLLNINFIKNFPNIDHRFDWLLFLNTFKNLENQKWINKDQISLTEIKLDTQLLSSDKVQIEPKESPTRPVEVNIEKSCINEPLNNLKQMGHELNTKGVESAAKRDMSTALQYWNCAAIFNYPPAQFNLGAYYDLNDDLISAEKWYRSAVNSGNHPVAAYNLAILLNNKFNDAFKAEINDLLHISAKQGCQEAQQCIDEIANPL